MSVTHEVFSVFIDTSKTFDKGWHNGIIFKLKPNGISGNLLDLLSDFLRDRKQRVVPNGQTSSPADFNPGVPQCSILGPLLLLVYIGDLADDLLSDAKLFLDNALLFSVIHNANTTAKELNNGLVKINSWAYQ